MDLKIFFSSVDDSIGASIKSPNSFYRSIEVNEGKMPDYKTADAVLIGLEENRGTNTNAGVSKAANAVREKLYNLQKGTGAYKIVDLGNLRNGVDLNETYKRIREVCEGLIEKNILPVLFGGSQDLDYGQFWAYEDLDKLISVLNVDAFLDMQESDDENWSRNHIHKIMLHEPNYLFNYSQLGHQTYLIDSKMMATIEKLYFEARRVGSLRPNLADVEPVVRDADMLTFDLTAVRSSDAPGNANAQPFGLTGEEACQICWYAGLNEKLSSVGFYEYNPERDVDGKTASVVATMIWYFVEGFYHRRNEADFRENDYLKYVVSMPSEPETLVFFKSKLSEKWWLEVPYPQGRERFSRNCIIPCSYSDYESANKGILPERWISTHAKLI